MLKMIPMGIVIAVVGCAPVTKLSEQSVSPRSVVTLENDAFKYVIGADGHNLHFIDKKTGTDYCDTTHPSIFARVTINEQDYDATSVTQMGENIEVEFAAVASKAVIRATKRDHYLVLEVVSVEGGDVDALTFIDVPLTLGAELSDSFIVCALAMDLQTLVKELPGLYKSNSGDSTPMARLRAECFDQFGFVGAQVALIGCSPDELRPIMKEVILAAPGLAKSPIGGPWAIESPDNRGSYIINSGVTEENIDGWIKLANQLGITQYDFHGGKCFRFGDCRVDPGMYPRGRESLKAVIDRLHEAGIKVGLHTYSHFISKEARWVTPIPDPRLAKDMAFTLVGDVSADEDTIRVMEKTEKMSTLVAWNIRNSVTLQIDDELIVYSGISKKKPYAFTSCQRGALGTKAVAHKAGSRVYHLKEYYGLFSPDGDSTLLDEVAQATADLYNDCGFDMIYFDALDGEDLMGDHSTGWHYGSKFVYEVHKRLKRPAIMEMATFHHHLWAVRARMGAWDHPGRAYKAFIDAHCEFNANQAGMYLPMHLGWWQFKRWSGVQTEPTYPDDIEYLLCKSLGNNIGFSLQGLRPGSVENDPLVARLAPIVRQYEELRHANYFNDQVKAELRQPGADFTLVEEAQDKWRFRRVEYQKYAVQGGPYSNSKWVVHNNFETQPVKLRIEARMSAQPYDSPDAVTLVDFSDPSQFSNKTTAPGVTFELTTSSDLVKVGQVSGMLSTTNIGQVDRNGAWGMKVKKFEPTLDISRQQVMGCWVHGDGSGQVINIDLRSPHQFHTAIGEHYIDVDFTGWRYFELIELDSDRNREFDWPYKNSVYGIYRNHVSYGKIESLGLWVNNIAPNVKSTCYISPIRAIPLVRAMLKNPTITVNGKMITFLVAMEPGDYLEFVSPTGCKHYSRTGEFLGDVQVGGEVPLLQNGENQIEFTCQEPTEVSPRARVTVIGYGDMI